MRCQAGPAARASELVALAKSQVDYILGSNPRGISYMVGYGARYPRRAHHRGASIVSIRANPSFVSCKDGYASWFGRAGSNPNLLDGAVVGGPDGRDGFADERNNYQQTEVATYNNAPLMGVLARLAGGGRGGLAEAAIKRPDNQTLLPPLAAAASPVEITQLNATASWKKDGRTYRRYAATVSNRSPAGGKTVEELHIGIGKPHGPVWGLQRARYGYVLPSSLAASESAAFAYVVRGRAAPPPADVWVIGYKLV